MKNKIYEFITSYYDIDYDVFIYGYGILLTYLLTFFIIFIISIYINIFFSEIIFWIFYIPLRKYSGGFHFSSKIICLFSSVISSVIVSSACFLSPISYLMRIAVIIFSIIVLVFLKTSNHPNKQLSDNEINIYTKKALLFECFYAILLLLPISNCTYYLNVIAATLIYSSFNLIFAKILKQG